MMNMLNTQYEENGAYAVSILFIRNTLDVNVKGVFHKDAIMFQNVRAGLTCTSGQRKLGREFDISTNQQTRMKHSSKKV